MNVFLSDLQFYALKVGEMFLVRSIIYIIFREKSNFFSFFKHFCQYIFIIFFKKTEQKIRWNKT